MNSASAILFVGLFFALFTVAGCKTQTIDRATVKSGGTPVFWNESGDITEVKPSAPNVELRAEALARFAVGYALELKRDLTNALDHYVQGVIADPSNEQLVLDVTRVLILRKEYAKAIEVLQRATETNTSSQLLVRLGWLYSQTGKTNDALKVLTESIQYDPFSIPAYQNLVTLYDKMDKPEKAIRILEKASKIKTTNYIFYADLAAVYNEFISRNTEKRTSLTNTVIKLLDLASKSDLDTLSFLLNLADGYEKAGAITRAIDLYSKILKIHRENPEVRVALLEKLAEMNIRAGDKQSAIKNIKALIIERPTNPIAYHYLGSVYFDTKEYEKAAENFKKAILLNPDFEPAYYDAAAALINADKPDDALQLLNNARSRFERRRFTLEFYTALAYSRKKNYSEALKAITEAEVIARASETNRLTPVLYFQIGAMLERNGQYKQAEEYFHKCLKMNPNFSEALNYLGYMWAERNENLKQAKELIERALKIEPDNAAYLDSLGWVYFRLKKYPQALYYIEKAAKLSEKPDPTILDHLGDIYAAMNKWNKALEFWNKSLELEQNDDIKKKIENAKDRILR